MARDLPKNLHIEQKNYADFNHAQALLAVAEQLKNPLLLISRQVEDARSFTDVEPIQQIADAGLTLIDSLLLSMRLHGDSSRSVLEPIALGAILYDVAHALELFAKQVGCRFEVEFGGRQQPVLVNPVALRAAMVNLGYDFITARTQTDQKRPVVTLAAHKSRWGFVAGLYSDLPGLNTAIFRRGQQLHGNSQSPMPSFSVGAGAGVFVADSLLRTMATNLRVSYHHKQSGLAATLLTSPQLSII